MPNFDTILPTFRYAALNKPISPSPLSCDHEPLIPVPQTQSAFRPRGQRNAFHRHDERLQLSIRARWRHNAWEVGLTARADSCYT